MRSRIPRRIKGIAAGIAAVSVMALAPFAAQPAEASSIGNVYVSYPTWLGNCPGGGSVTGIYAASGNLWSTPATGDLGDDLIYPKVYLYANNQISAQVFCSRAWYNGGNYWGPAVSATIYPTRTGQTFWVGPTSQTHN